MSAWRGQYRIALDGRPVAVWDPSWWRSGGEFEADGYRFAVRANAWGTAAAVSHHLDLASLPRDRQDRA